MLFVLSSWTLNTSEGSASFVEAGVMSSSDSSGFIFLDSTISDKSRPQLPSMKSHKLWCKTRALLLPVVQAGKMAASYFDSLLFLPSSCIGFWVYLPPYNITLSPANKRTDQSSAFHTSIDATAHAVLDTEQLISHTRSPLVDTFASLQGSDGGVFAASEVHKLLTKIHDILKNSV